jgi:hypothetical protein
MAGPKAYLRLLLAIACIVVSLAAMINVFADNGEVVSSAKGVACPSGPCDIARSDRTPFAQTFDFRTTKGTVTVRCARAAIFFGEYACSKP